MSVTARKVGEWAELSRKMRMLNKVMPAASGIMLQEAHQLKTEVVNAIKAQDYEWDALSDSYAARKAREGLDPRTLIATGKSLRSIRVLPMGPGLWGIGITKTAKNKRGQSIADIMLRHEFGWGPFPARPLWRKEYRKSEARLMMKLKSALGVML